MGEHDLSTNMDCLQSRKITFCAAAIEEYGVESFIAHRGFSRHSQQHDIALIRLDRDVEFKGNNNY